MRAFAVALCLASVAGCNDAGKDVQRLSIGSPCVTSGDCGTGRYFCATGEPNGYCQRECGKDADCPDGQICAPAGTLNFKIRACVAAGCKVDADCTAYPGGVCAPIDDPCCNATAGLSCVYPGGCRHSSDCPPQHFCQITGSQAACQPGAPVCPL